MNNKEYVRIDMEATGKKIFETIKLKKIKVNDVLDFLKISSAQSIYNWRNGRNLPTVDNLYALSVLLEVPIDELICGNKDL